MESGRIIQQHILLTDEVALHWVRSERVVCVFYVNGALSTGESTHICLLATDKKLLKESLNLHRFGFTTSLVCPLVPRSRTRVGTYPLQISNKKYSQGHYHFTETTSGQNFIYSFNQL